MIDVQTLNDALLTLAFCVGLALLLAVSIVAAGALTQWHERRAHVRSIERLDQSAYASRVAARASDPTPFSLNATVNIMMPKRIA